jgi:hypothetical protein
VLPCCPVYRRAACIIHTYALGGQVVHGES